LDKGETDYGNSRHQSLFKSSPQQIGSFANGFSALRISRLRALIPACFTIFCLYAGYRFYHFYLWTIDRSETYVSRPPSVEAFLPISALLGMKRLVLTGQWDPVHPAGLTIFLAAWTIAFVLRKGFCGWICPVGFMSNLIEKIGKPFRFADHLPAWLDYPLLCLKYILLAFFIYIILLQMDLQSIEAFLFSPYNLVSDAKMLLFSLEPSSLTVAIMGFLLLISLVIRNFWCRCLCAYGALLGFLAIFSPMQVSRKASLCIDCKKCENICPASIRITRSETLRYPECIGCMECVEVCPQKGCLSFQAPRKKLIPISIVPIAILVLLGLFFVTAMLTGHWRTAMPPDVTKSLYQSAGTFAHP
jgi:Pyruvate/2-oxoacid:ferredoxin oxidoreductase delta subunit